MGILLKDNCNFSVQREFLNLLAALYIRITPTPYYIDTATHSMYVCEIISINLLIKLLIEKSFTNILSVYSSSITTLAIGNF